VWDHGTLLNQCRLHKTKKRTRLHGLGPVDLRKKNEEGPLKDQAAFCKAQSLSRFRPRETHYKIPVFHAKCMNHIGDRMRHIGNSMRMLAAVQNWLQWYQKMICCGTVTKTVNNGMKYISWCEKVKGYEIVLVNKYYFVRNLCLGVFRGLGRQARLGGNMEHCARGHGAYTSSVQLGTRPPASGFRQVSMKLVARGMKS